MLRYKNIDVLCHILEGYAETANDANGNPIYYELLPVIQEIRDISTPFYLKMYWKIKSFYYNLIGPDDSIPF